jgi:WD40 repeat protein
MLASAVLWDARTGEEVRTFRGHLGVVSSVGISGEGTRVLTGSNDCTAILWDAIRGGQYDVFNGHTHDVTGVDMSSDWRRVITSSSDGTTRIWDTTTGKELAKLISFDDGKGWLVATPDGHFDGSPGADRFVRYHIAGTIDRVPLERLRNDFEQPGLLAKVWMSKN